VTRAPAPAKLNLALVVGPLGADGKHEVTTVYQRIDLADRVSMVPARTTSVSGFAGDTLVRGALDGLAEASKVDAGWRVELTKRIPVAAGLGGGSSDAATALRLANQTLEKPLPDAPLRKLAARLGADVAFFLEQGPQLGEGDGTRLTPVALPQDYWIVLVLPQGSSKTSSAAVYEAFDRRDGAKGYRNRRAALKRALTPVRRPRDLAALPQNDLASSPVAGELLAEGAFRADVSGAGPAVYGLFQHLETARAARRVVAARGRTWLTAPAWYG
jgi:4-diphosphocytidyl-2-C-methyl-D-erythritol kinase